MSLRWPTVGLSTCMYPKSHRLIVDHSWTPNHLQAQDTNPNWPISVMGSESNTQNQKTVNATTVPPTEDKSIWVMGVTLGFVAWMILLHMELSRVVALMVPVVPHFWGTIPSLLTRICSIIGASCYFHLFIAIKIHCFCLDILWYPLFFLAYNKAGFEPNQECHWDTRLLAFEVQFLV